MKTLKSNISAKGLKLTQNNYFKTFSFNFRTKSIRKVFLNLLIVTVIATSLNSCATIGFGGDYVFQKNKPIGEPERRLRVGALISDIIFLPGLILDFATGDIYQPVDPNKKNKKNSSLNTVLCDSISKKYYTTGELLCETPYKNGKINGTQSFYYKSGKIMSETPFTNGLANGICTTYYQDGRWLQERTYVDGNINGLLVDKIIIPIHSGRFNFVNNKAYNRNGVLIYEIPQSNGIINGDVIEYYLTNRDKLDAYYVIPFVNNIMNGKAKYYYEGSLYGEWEYKDGIKIPNEVDIAAIATAGVGLLQVGTAYYNVKTNPNAQSLNAFNQVTNNFISSKNMTETIIANNNILSNSINTATKNSQITPESSASTNGGSFNHNAGDALKCSNDTQNQWKNSVEYNNYLRNPDCNKMAYISQRQLAELILQNCSQYLPPAEVDGFRKTISSLTSTINSMEDCKTYNFK